MVFTNGCFDLLHRGHLAALEEAKSLGDILIVGMNSDASVRRLKGNGRPMMVAADRTQLLAGFSCVDHVVVFEEETPLELIKQVRPDVLAKGGDYRPEDIVGKREVESWGGKVAILTFVAGKSTTQLLQKIKND